MKPCGKNRKPIAWLAVDALEAQEARGLRAHLKMCEGCRGYFEQMTAVAQTLQEFESKSDVEPSEAFHERMSRALGVAAGRREEFGVHPLGSSPFPSPNREEHREELTEGKGEGVGRRGGLREGAMAVFRGLGFGWRMAMVGLVAVMAIFLWGRYLTRQSEFTKPIVERDTSDISFQGPAVGGIRDPFNNPINAGPKDPPRTSASVARLTGLSPTLANYHSVANRSLDQLDDLLSLQGGSCCSPSPVYSAGGVGGAGAVE
jgi:hypothetical protein